MKGRNGHGPFISEILTFLIGNIIRKQVGGQTAICSTKRGHARSLVSGAARSQRRSARPERPSQA